MKEEKDITNYISEATDETKEELMDNKGDDEE